MRPLENLSQVAIVVGAFAAVTTVLRFIGEWIARYLGFESARQDGDRDALRKDHDELRIAVKTEFAALHDRVTREAGKRQEGDNSLLEKIHGTQLALAERYQTRTDAQLMEKRIIEAINNAAARDRNTRRGGQQ